MIVPNKNPAYWLDQKIALVGEAPGGDELRVGTPFVGYSGQHLDRLLAIAGCPTRHNLYLGNVSQVHPPANNITSFQWSGPEIQSGLTQLRNDMERLKPNIVVLLGNVPLKAARDPERGHPLKPNSYSYKVSKWRGTLFTCDQPKSPFFGLKCMATYHPAYALRDYTVNPLIRFDLLRAREESESPTLTLPQRRIQILTTAEEVVVRLNAIRCNRYPTALDIEGGLGTMSCISFACSLDEAWVVPFYTRTGHYVWDQEEGCRVWRALAQLLEDPLVPKILQNALYDLFVLHYGYAIRVRGLVDDTMLSGWEIYSQLRKSLGMQASIWTREPFYKHERLQEGEDDET